MVPQPRSPRTSETVTDPAAIAATIQALSPAFKTGWKLGFEGLACDLPDCVARDATAQHLEDFNEGHRQGRIARAKRGDDGSPSMLIDATTRKIMAGNGVVEQVEAFDELTGPIDPGMGIVEKLHGKIVHSFPRVAGLPSPVPSIAGDALSSSGATDAPRDTSTPAASASVAGAFRLSDNQRDSLIRMARIAASTGYFEPMFSQIEGLVHADRFDRAIAEGGKAIDKAFGHAAEMVKTQTTAAKKATVARCNACPKCGSELEYTPAERGTNTAGGYDCSDPDCGYQCGLEGGAR